MKNINLMKTRLLLITLLLFCLSQAQQNNSGMGLSPYSGVYSLQDNPAGIVGGLKKWDFNLLSISASVGNNKAEFGIDKINLEKMLDDILIEKGAFSTNVNLNITGPSFTFHINPKNSFGIITRARVMANVDNVDTQLVNSVREGEINQTLFPYKINSNENQRVTVSAWSEVGANYAIEVFSDERNSIRVGATLKYLLGTANSYINLDKLKGTIALEAGNNNSDIKPYLTDATTALTFVSSGVDVFDNNKFEIGDLTKFKGSGIGGDLGVVYELKLGNDAESTSGYTLRAGASLLDIGSIKYKPEPGNAYSYFANIPADKRFYLSDLSGNFSEIQDILKKSPYFKHKDVSGEYSAGLPTSLYLFADYNLISNFYLAGSARFNMVDTKEAPQNVRFTDTYSLLPRFETKFFGFYLPINYDEISSLSVGAGLRLGPLFVGSGSVISALMSKTQQADVFFGLRFGN